MTKRLLIITAAVITMAYTAMAAVIKGTLRDESNEPLIGGTVTLLHLPDSVQVKSVATDINGRFSLSGIKSGRYALRSTYVGYNPTVTPVKVGENNITLPDIRLRTSSIMLNEATVTAVKTPVKVMEDTVEYNADTYKTQPNAVVEDLLKRLPGVEVDSEGKITANGKEVTKILVDGKEFFSDDPKVASKNLPVNMVDKLQVVDRKSDLARMTGVDDGEDETVINLTVKKGMKNGWFGTAEAGYGTDGRYQGTFNINRFYNDNQFTILGSANNTNDLGFTDGNGNRFRRFGSAQGINTSQSIGLNFNVGNKEIFRIGGNVLYSHTDMDSRKRQNRQFLFPDSTSYAESGSINRNKGHNVRGDFRIQWKPDSANSFDFRPNFSFNHVDNSSIDSTLTLSGLRMPVTRSFNTSSSQGNSFEFGGAATFNHNFRSHPGRSYSLNVRYRLSNVREKTDTYSHNLFYLFNDSIDAYDQYEDNHTWSNMIQARATWTEPIGDASKGRFLTFSYRMQYRWNNADKLTYDRELTWPDGPLGIPHVDPELHFVDTLSNSFRNNFFTQDIRLGFKLVKKTSTLDAGLSLVPSMSQSYDLINSGRNIPRRWVWNYAPFLRYRYKLGKSRSLMVNYRGNSQQPSMTQLQPVADYSNPLRVVIGNPNLDPTFTHFIRLRFQDFNAESQRSIMAMADAQIRQNSIVSRTQYNSQTGGQVTTYDNVNGAWSLRVMNMISQPLRNKHFTISNHIFANLNHSVGYNNGERNNSMSTRIFEMFAFAWRPDNIELELRPNYSVEFTHNSLSNMSTPTVHRYGGMFSGTYYTPFGLVLSTDVNYSGTSGYAQGYNQDQWMWNGSISYQFMPGKAATVALKVYDLLQQKSDISRTVTANYIDDSSFNTLTRYFMLTFTYRFNTFGAGNEPQSRTMRRGPMGPPPRH